jgi:hypothetical protein
MISMTSSFYQMFERSLSEKLCKLIQRLLKEIFTRFIKKFEIFTECSTALHNHS